MTTQASTTPPHFNSKPVILVHLLAGTSTRIAWCAPIEYIEDSESYPNIPRVMCPACAKAGIR